jgi:hypothetical protein
MSRTATIQITYESDLTSAKNKYDEFLAYVNSHQPSINGVPVGASSGPSAGPATARTFGGGSSIAGPTMAERGASESWRWRNESATGRVFQNESDGPTMAMRGASAGFGSSPNPIHNYGAGYGPITERGTFRVGGATPAVSDYLTNYGSNYGPFTDRGTFRSGSGGREPIYNYGSSYGPRLPDNSFTSGFGGRDSAMDSFAQRVYLEGLSAGGGGSGLDSLPGIRSMLGGQGFRGLGRYVGPFGIAAGLTSVLSQGNQFGISMAGASSAGDVIKAQEEYQSNDALAKIPILGGLGSAINEFYTGYRADIAGAQAGTAGVDSATGILSGIGSARLGGAASVASAGGDFAGKLRSIDLTQKRAIQDVTQKNADRITQIGQAIDTIVHTHALDPNILPGRNDRAPILSKAEQVSISGLTSERAALLLDNSVTAQIARQNAEADKASVGRSSSAYFFRSSIEAQALRMEATDFRGAARLRLSGQYDPRGTTMLPGSDEFNAMLPIQSGALLKEDADYNRRVGFGIAGITVGAARLQSQQFSDEHLDYQARYAAANEQRKQAELDFKIATAGVPKGTSQYSLAESQRNLTNAAADSADRRTSRDIPQDAMSLKYSDIANRMRLSGNPLGGANMDTWVEYQHKIDTDPNHAALYEAARSTAYSSNFLDEGRRQFGEGMTNQRIQQSTQEQNLRNQWLFRTAGVQSTISGGVNAIEQGRIDLPGGPGTANYNLLQQRIDLIKSNVDSSIHGQINPLLHGNRLEQVSGWVMGGDRGNMAYKDLRSAQDLGKTANSQLHDAATGKLGGADTSQQLQQLINKAEQIITTIAHLL